MRAAALVLAIAIFSQGCSVLLMDTVPEGTYKRQHCTKTKGFSVWDGVLGLGNAVSSVAAFIYAGDVEPGTGTSALLYASGIAGAVASLVYFASASHGATSAERCRELWSKPETPNAYTDGTYKGYSEDD